MTGPFNGVGGNALDGPNWLWTSAAIAARAPVQFQNVGVTNQLGGPLFPRQDLALTLRPNDAIPVSCAAGLMPPNGSTMLPNGIAVPSGGGLRVYDSVQDRALRWSRRCVITASRFPTAAA